MSDSEDGLSVAIFGATGTVGDGILKAAIADQRVRRILVVTRRHTDRIEAGMNSGRLEVVMHQDYMDYLELILELSGIDAVFWAIGTSATNVDDEQYTVIHVDFPVAFMKTWLKVKPEQTQRIFHLVSGAGTSGDSWFHWAREKAKAESAVKELSTGSDILALAYRPSFVFPTTERISGFQKFTRSMLLPLKRGVDSRTIGCAMIRNSLAPPSEPTTYDNAEILALGCEPD